MELDLKMFTKRFQREGKLSQSLQLGIQINLVLTETVSLRIYRCATYCFK